MYRLKYDPIILNKYSDDTLCYSAKTYARRGFFKKLFTFIPCIYTMTLGHIFTQFSPSDSPNIFSIYLLTSFFNNLVSPMNVVHIHIWAITLLLLQNKGDREDIYN